MRLRLLRRFRKDERGAAMVEFAIVAPLLFALIFGIVDFGRVFFLYNNLTNAAREGARFGATRLETETGLATTIQTLVRSRINDTNASTAGVTTTWQGAAGVRTVRVTIVNYPFSPVTFLAIRSAKQLNVRAEFRVELQ